MKFEWGHFRELGGEAVSENLERFHELCQKAFYPHEGKERTRWLNELMPPLITIMVELRNLAEEEILRGAEEGEVLLANLPLLTRFGFSVEDFGGGALAVREVPDYLDPGQIAPALSEIAEAILTGGGADPDSARDAVLHTMACKAAVKGGQDNSPEELMVVAKAVVSGQVKYCPHGRPVAITLTKKELEKQFKRA